MQFPTQRGILLIIKLSVSDLAVRTSHSSLSTNAQTIIAPSIVPFNHKRSLTFRWTCQKSLDRNLLNISQVTYLLGLPLLHSDMISLLPTLEDFGSYNIYQVINVKFHNQVIIYLYMS